MQTHSSRRELWSVSDVVSKLTLIKNILESNGGIEWTSLKISLGIASGGKPTIAAFYNFKIGPEGEPITGNVSYTHTTTSTSSSGRHLLQSESPDLKSIILKKLLKVALKYLKDKYPVIKAFLPKTGSCNNKGDGAWRGGAEGCL